MARCCSQKAYALVHQVQASNAYEREDLADEGISEAEFQHANDLVPAPPGRVSAIWFSHALHRPGTYNRVNGFPMACGSVLVWIIPRLPSVKRA